MLGFILTSDLNNRNPTSYYNNRIPVWMSTNGTVAFQFYNVRKVYFTCKNQQLNFLKAKKYSFFLWITAV